MKERMKKLWKDQRGAGVVEMLLIMVVLIGLVVIFRSQLLTLVNNIFDSLQQQAGSIY